MSNSLDVERAISLDLLHDHPEGVRCRKESCNQAAARTSENNGAVSDDGYAGLHEIVRTSTDQVFPQLIINPQPSPRLPIELISIICEFVSGDRALATLASVNTSCSLFRSISMPILYETVFWDDKADWMSVFPRDHECWKHIKYAFTLTTSSFDDLARRSRTNDSQIHCPKLQLSCALKCPNQNAVILRLSQTMKTSSLIRLIRQTELRHWDEETVSDIRLNTSSSLFLELDSGVTLLPDAVNAKGYYPIPNDMPIIEACLRLPKDDEPIPTYDFLLEICRMLAQSREGYFDTDHRCAKSLPMLMLVLENETQTEQFKSAVRVIVPLVRAVLTPLQFVQLLMEHPEHVNFHFRILGIREYRLRDVYCFVRHLARAYALSYAHRPDHPAFTGRSILAVRLFHKNLHAYLRYSPEAPTTMELEIWQERQEGTLISEVWDFQALRESDIPSPAELRWIAVEEELDDEGNARVVREEEVNSSDVGDDGSDDSEEEDLQDEEEDLQEEEEEESSSEQEIGSQEFRDAGFDDWSSGSHSDGGSLD